MAFLKKILHASSNILEIESVEDQGGKLKQSK